MPTYPPFQHNDLIEMSGSYGPNFQGGGDENLNFKYNTVLFRF